MDNERAKKNFFKALKAAFKEDIGSEDITSAACIPAKATLSGRIILKQWGRLAGLPFLEPAFQMIDPAIKIKLLVEEGTIGNAGTVIGTISGPARGIITAERVILNFLQYASGIATMTTLYKEEIDSYNPSCDLLDTRKTLPGLRSIAKYAVRVGGGKNHRDSLDERFVIKANHLAFIDKKAKSPILKATEKAHKYRSDVKVEVEIGTLSALKEVLKDSPDIIMLKYMNSHMVKKAVKMIRASNKDIYIEAYGGIVLDTIGAYADTGVDGIAVTEITHSVQSLDISIRF
ncbi:MAG: carboxylating nicotinate-nucleotide diphosphorylase [Waddliaceae bacterium]|nr:carboxylating nicotinate-nucleotide diphosphorylase [Waddliaceae bacterium]MBT3579442.1 carboxylating nicotinate-nucleotide diphosphorylase [Waddliaceae bacterium]MBT4445157.1 carboxylating nicotinate-nucleotide diphosphorylase [Waddliaceae bacterium]MBT6928941.1 carboxylating nicotinate-nucleotide diphosphorylase [Waddliaceae bacterium]MBT7264473.1 carboxylating nicotinate-nucleotide diphosphorylase [Waddliaceae bacterium]